MIEQTANLDAWCESNTIPFILGRGLKPVRYFSPGALLSQLKLDEANLISEFYQLEQRYSVRLLLHDLLAHPDGLPLKKLLHYCSENSARGILNNLISLGLVAREGNDYRFQFAPVLRTGDLAELFTGMLLIEEFQLPVLCNVSLGGNSSGGDFDILANWMQKLLYVEVKSAPPKGIHNSTVAAFLDRIVSLVPDIAIFLNDTHLRVKDKIVLMFEEELIRLQGIGSLENMPIQRVSEQIFQLNHYIYIMNSRRDLKMNFAVVFNDYLRYNLPLDRLAVRR